ncbi:FAD-dependent oxidoreductase [Halopseudomonas aestusnigri]|uniref:2,4-dienoyl-CoA reductase (NADPH2) n=1 Tax=Halopseudomonas aestusnigri TaxID=857252 RepID=A0AAQ1G617_9GAMM|nr:FAD-dependent oxidoreductase [Halopseudomonas aestusnigri]OWL89208.1 effector protein [Halopseudomonas aestusnigri]SEG05344.1 2,4-dienoyl-CoA reductase (NADPH2) [Halopseudomonas aestusnigri]
MSYKNLLSAGRIGRLHLRNRIIMAPMGSNFAEADGTCGERIQAYYEARAAGGAGLLIMGVCAVAFPAGTAEPYQVGVSEDRFIPGLSQLAARVHRHGAKIAMQLQHAGKTAARDIAEGRELWVPSMPPPMKTDMMAALTPEELRGFISGNRGRPSVRVMDKADITQMIEWFAAAAVRAQQAGFDGVEIHAAHSYIIAGFLSPYYNRRDDEYGGSIDNRARLMLEVLREVRRRTGEDFGVWLRLDAAELHTEGGITLDECKQFARMAEQAGADAVSVSAYATIKSGVAFTEAPLVQQPAGFLEWATEVRSAVRIPVIAVGRIEPELADSAIADGRCDFVAMARKMLADPELPNKLMRGDAAAIRPCIYCYVCVSQIFVNERVKCAVNPFTGNESRKLILPADPARHVVVVGGGPAGLEAARLASLRGMRVTLLERSSQLGGTLFFAALPYPENGKLLDNLVHQVRQLPIDVRLNTEASPQMLRELGADHVLVANGASRVPPHIPGADGAHVWSGDELRRLMTGDRAQQVARSKLSVLQRGMLMAGTLIGATRSTSALRQLSRLWMPLGKQVVIIGGGLVGLELAEFLAERGRSVSVVEPTESLGRELSIVRRWRVLDNLRKHSVAMHRQTSVVAIDQCQVHCLDENGGAFSLPADSVVIALGAAPQGDLAEQLTRSGIAVSRIGDCNEVGYIEGALRSATDAVLAL